MLLNFVLLIRSLFFAAELAKDCQDTAAEHAARGRFAQVMDYQTPEQGVRQIYDALRVLLRQTLPRRGEAVNKSQAANKAFLLSRLRNFTGNEGQRMLAAR